jgi:hypothetical protein
LDIPTANHEPFNMDDSYDRFEGKRRALLAALEEALSALRHAEASRDPTAMDRYQADASAADEAYQTFLREHPMLKKPRP